MQKNDNEDTPDVEREEWNVQELAEQSTNMPSDEIMRTVLRGDETVGTPDERDIAGGANSNDTPQGRHEAKKTDKS